MKVKCPDCDENGKAPNCAMDITCETCGGVKYLDINIPTADLLAELEKRRNCEKCLNWGWKCDRCIFYNLADNFKTQGGK